MRTRPIVALPLVAALFVAGCGLLGSGANGTVCPSPTLEPVTLLAVAGSAVTYGFLVDRAYTVDAKRSPSYSWPQLPKTALDTVASALTKLDLRPGGAILCTSMSRYSTV